MTPYYEHAAITIYHGDCRELLGQLEPQSIHSVVTSPPYAEQRKKLYGGIPEADYPAWTVAWMAAVARVLKPGGSVLINIREHVKDGQISDYVHHTRLAVRAAGWVECEELIWVKKNAPPVGHPGRPRRSWERVLWFSLSRQPWCDPRANGRPCSAPVMGGGQNMKTWVAGTNGRVRDGIARSADMVSLALGGSQTGHPAAYPPELAAWMARLVTPPGETVLDPFFGSGSTAVGVLPAGFQCVGMEQRADYCEVAARRLSQEVMQLSA